MPIGRADYVKGQQLAWPHGQRLVSGPFDDAATAYAELERIRPFYPDAHLHVVSHSGRSLPVCTPRSMAPNAAEPEREAEQWAKFDLSKAAGRRAAADAIADCARQCGATAIIEDWDGEPDVDIAVPMLRANIWIGWTAAAPMPIISWHKAAYPLVQVLPGAWRQEGSYRNGKTTSLPDTWPALFAALQIGLCAAVDGTAFEA